MKTSCTTSFPTTVESSVYPFDHQNVAFVLPRKPKTIATSMHGSNTHNLIPHHEPDRRSDSWVFLVLTPESRRSMHHAGAPYNE